MTDVSVPPVARREVTFSGTGMIVERGRSMSDLTPVTWGVGL